MILKINPIQPEGAMLMALKPLPVNQLDEGFIGSWSLMRLFFLPYVPSVEHLQKALDRVLEHYSTICGRVETSAAEGTRLLPGEGPIAIQIGDADDWDSDKFSAADAERFAGQPETIPGRSLLSVKLTRVRGGAILGVSVSHMVADAFSLFEFLKAWTDCLVGRPFQLPSPQRQFSSSNNYAPARSGEAPGWRERLKATQSMARKYTVIRFGADDLNRLRREHSTEGFAANTNEALTGYLFAQFWQSFVEGGVVPRLRMPINIRGVLPNISDRYIGNAIFHAVLDTEKDNVSSPVAFAMAIRETVKKNVELIRDGRIISMGPSGLEYDMSDYPRHNPARDVISANVSRFRFHELDFGGGLSRRIFCPVSPTGFTLNSFDAGIEVHILSKGELKRGPVGTTLNHNC